jgi:UDP-N-acetylmuramoyl-L-alanyl-D-glutamate--2,6-diaminopimelate ligase
MKRLDELFDVKSDIVIDSISEDSRVIKSNSLFFCIEGLTVDGHQYAKKAVENGAVAVVASKDIDVNVPVIKVKDTNMAMLQTLSKFYGEPDKKIKLIGVTGTDGKTTLSNIIYQLINRMDTCGFIGTGCVECSQFYKEQAHTTPFPVDLYPLLNDLYHAGCNYVSMEATSERLGTDRLNDLEFDVAIFTNLTRDHLNTHKTMENYATAKMKLFKLVKNNGYSLVNMDDPYGEQFMKSAHGHVVTYGINHKADIMAKDIVVTKNLLTFTLIAPYGEYYIESPLSGKYNVYNLMAAITTCYVLGFDIKNILESIKYLTQVKGRETYVECGQPFKVIVDYAHTANAIRNLLEFLNLMKKKDSRVIIVVGSGGHRDKGRRIELGEAMAELVDYIVFTSEDPRTEDPNDIIDDIMTNIKDKNIIHERVLDRIEAIHRAIDIARKDDIILIAGKGTETFMDIGTETVSYPTDYKVAFDYLKEKEEVTECH